MKKDSALPLFAVWNRYLKRDVGIISQNRLLKTENFAELMGNIRTIIPYRIFKFGRLYYLKKFAIYYIVFLSEILNFHYYFFAISCVMIRRCLMEHHFLIKSCAGCSSLLFAKPFA